MMHANSAARSVLNGIGWFLKSALRKLPFVHDGRASEVGVRVVNRAETRRELDVLARREFDMTGAEFLVALRDGTLPKSPAVDHLALLAEVAETS